ncbi:MAG TPA: hypothetical protein VGJ48_17030 [Pyrinomonadaceae bacterium]|jgi:hypothetical protein
MENHRMLSTVIRISFAAAVCLLTLAPNSAQSQGSVPGAPPVKDPFSEARERQQREAQLRSAEMVGPAKIVNTRDLEAAAKRMRDDFKGIQVMRNNVVRHLQSEKPLDYKFIASETEGIHKRANRLKADMARESVEGEKKEEGKRVDLADNQMKDALVTMCKRIDSFTENPVFKLPGVVDAAHSAKASRDLRDIILLSGGIVKLAQKLNKSPGK